ncbi:hypothetical protein ACLBOM_23175 [Escherichia coli]
MIDQALYQPAVSGWLRDWSSPSPYARACVTLIFWTLRQVIHGYRWHDRQLRENHGICVQPDIYSVLSRSWNFRCFKTCVVLQRGKLVRYCGVLQSSDSGAG